MKRLIFQNHYYLPLLILIVFLGCKSKVKKESAETTFSITKSEIRETSEGFRLYLNDEPFFIKGAGVDKGDIAALAEHGGNALRTWSTDNGKEVLDKAQELGLKVMMGIWVGLERHGFDYNDEIAINKQLESIKERVLALKDHPALIMWGVGNEMNHSSKNPKVWDAINDISKMIHEIDPYHLTTTPLAGINKELASLVGERAPDLDFLSVQLYGPMDFLPEIIENSTYKAPLLITEWGATGYWEVPKTEWGAPIENNSSVKADLYLSRYENSIRTQSKQIFGSFVFLWGQKQERTPTWFGMFAPKGNETESVDVMHYVWNGKWPKNRTPRLEGFTLEGKSAINNIKLKSGNTYESQVQVSDPDNDELTYRWEIMKESESKKSGGDAEYIPDTLNDLFLGNPSNKASFVAPNNSGAYRLYIYVEDGNKHTAHANIPFFVEE